MSVRSVVLKSIGVFALTLGIGCADGTALQDLTPEDSAKLGQIEGG